VKKHLIAWKPHHPTFPPMFRSPPSS
jgi:hypothetical protein